MIATILWVATFVSGVPHLGEHPPTMQLDQATMRASGFAGCNRYSGEYSKGRTRFQLGELAMTRMMCADEAMKVEDAFSADLGHVRSYRMVNGGLQFYDAEGMLLLRFKQE